MPNYLYNGVELPDIEGAWSVLDEKYEAPAGTAKQYYPYVTVTKVGSSNTLYLYLYSNRIYADGDSVKMPAETSVMGFLVSDGAWVFVGQFGHYSYDAVLGDKDDLLWTSHDILNADGSVYLAASEPIPVGGEPEKPNTGFLYLTSMLLGWLVGRRIAGQRGKYVEPDVPDVPSGVYDDTFPIEWNTLAVVDNPTAAMGDLPFVKVSNLTPTQEEMQSMVLASTFGGGSLLELPYMDGGAFDLGYGATYGTAPAFLVVVVTTAGQSAELEVTFPETGIYVENYGVDGTDINLAIKEAPKTPIAYLYNGVQLPDINTVWTDKEKYPYAAMRLNSSDVYEFVTSSVEMYYDGDFLHYGPGHYYSLSDGAWVLDGALSNPVVVRFGPFWSNHEITNSADGTTYLAASEPVPVYE